MHRRDFLHKATLAVAALAIDPEELIWTKKKTIFVPRPVPPDPLGWFYTKALGWTPKKKRIEEQDGEDYYVYDYETNFPFHHGPSPLLLSNTPMTIGSEIFTRRTKIATYTQDYEKARFGEQLYDAAQEMACARLPACFRLRVSDIALAT